LRLQVPNRLTADWNKVQRLKGLQRRFGEERGWRGRVSRSRFAPCTSKPSPHSDHQQGFRCHHGDQRDVAEDVLHRPNAWRNPRTRVTNCCGRLPTR